MPGVKDITSDIGRLRKRNILPDGTPPALPTHWVSERKQAFNPFGWFFWTVIALFLLLQIVFLVWVA
jgi:hypothetical protein